MKRLLAALMFLNVTSGTTLIADTAFAAAQSDGSSCQDVMDGAHPIHILSSGRDADVLPQLQEAAEELPALARDLGMTTPPHVMSFLPATEMNVLSSLGRHSAPHWVDGEQILRNLKSAGNILEFVTRGCDICRSYYSDLNPLKHQISIIMHVLGHNDVGANSNFHRAVYTDSMGYSKEFAEKVQWLYIHYDHDEVSLYVQWLYSLEYMQNLVFAGYDPPEDFKPEMETLERVEHVGLLSGQKKIYHSVKHPKRPSANIMQALVRNLPSNTPTWKKELLDLYERSRRFYSGNIATKIMNEGWATFSQFLLARHSKYVTDDDIAEFGSLLAGVTYPDLSNPYYLGLQGWWHKWEQYKALPENQELTAKEVDRKFVAKAHEIIAVNDDFSFIDMAFDQEWVDKMKFNLVRPVDRGDNIDVTKVPPQPSQDAALMVSLSRHRDRVVRYIQRRVASRQLMFPHVLIDDFNWLNSGVVHLRHEMQEDIPLEEESMYQAMFVLSQIVEKPIALTYSRPKVKQGQPRGPWDGGDQRDIFPFERQGKSKRDGSGVGSGGQDKFVALVKPTGRVSVYKWENDGEAKSLHEISDVGGKDRAKTTRAQSIIDQFKSEVIGLVNHKYRSERLEPIWQKLVNQALDGQVAPTKGLVNFAPHAGAAIWEYHKTVENVLVERMREMIKKGHQPKVKGGKLSIPVLPKVPHFELDRRELARIMAEKPPAPIDRGVYDPAVGDFDQDDNSLLIHANLLPGDVFWSKGSGGGGQGQGEGQGEGNGKGKGKGKPEEGEGEGEEEGGIGIGDGGGEVLVPVEFWGELLGDTLELPNIRRTDGGSHETVIVRRGSVRKPSGYELDELTVANAMEKAIALRKKRGRPYRLGETDPETGQVLNKRTLIREAVPLIDMGDIVVSHHMETPLPDFEAVLVVAGDDTGSMAGERLEMAKQLIFNVKTLLRAGYKKITIRYVMFNTEAKEVTEEDFFKNTMGGGTAYNSGLMKSKEILDEYPNSKYNKYLMVVGDGESYDSEDCKNTLRSLFPDLQFFSFAVTKGRNGLFSDPFVRDIKSLKSEWPWVGVSELHSREDVIHALPELFPKVP